MNTPDPFFISLFITLLILGGLMIFAAIRYYQLRGVRKRAQWQAEQDAIRFTTGNSDHQSRSFPVNNAGRADRARYILRIYEQLSGDDPDDNYRTAMIDLLADLMHYSANWDEFEAALNMAETHYNEECDEEED